MLTIAQTRDGIFMNRRNWEAWMHMQDHGGTKARAGTKGKSVANGLVYLTQWRANI